MRKFILAMLSAVIMITACLSGCSCIGSSPISFNANFYDKDTVVDPPAGYKETLTYNVVFTDKISEDQSKSPLLNNANYSFSEGVYVSTLETVTSVPNVTSDIIDGLPSDAKTLYKLTTKLSIKSTYSGFNEGDGEYLDTVEGVVYFCSYRLSFAPIYSFVKTDYSMLLIKNDVSAVVKLQSERTINYSKDKYVLTEKINEELTTSEYEYDFTTVIDNAQLLFALRNIEIDADSTFNLPTVSYAYGEAKDLRIDNESQTSTLADITINGNNVKENIPVNNYSFMVNDSVKAGVPQKVSIQSDKSDNIAFNSLLYSYTEPLIEYGNMLSMGYLVYTLSSVEIVR